MARRPWIDYPGDHLRECCAEVKRLREEQRAMMDSYDTLHHEARNLWKALVACAEYAPDDVKILISLHREGDSR